MAAACRYHEAMADHPAVNLQRPVPRGGIESGVAYRVALEAVHPVIHLAHRQTSAGLMRERIIVDHELYLVLDGEATVYVRGKSIPARAGTLVLFEPFAPHWIESHERVDHIAVHFDFTPEAPGELRLEKRGPYSVTVGDGAMPGHTRIAPTGTLATELVTLARAWRGQSPSGRLHATAKLMSVIARLNSSERTKAFSSHRKRLERVIDLIEQDYAAPLRAEDLAGTAGLSLAHFNRLFRQWTGASPMRYLEARRVEVARQMLEHEAAAVHEVARRCGFADPYHFSRVFKRVEGISPTAFRAAALGKL